MRVSAVLLVAFFASGPALAQDTSRAYTGKGSNAGGYANELNRGTGAPLAKPVGSPRQQIDPAYRGKGSNAGGYANELNRGSGAPLAHSTRHQADPAYQGKGSNAGGYANELNRPRARQGL